MQAITMPEERYAAYLGGCDFIQHYIFPGGCLPSISALQHAASHNGSFRLTAAVEMGRHYAETLRLWRARFEANEAAVRAQGYDAAFRRLWDYYLRYCEAGFDASAITTHQLLWTKPSASRMGQLEA